MESCQTMYEVLITIGFCSENMRNKYVSVIRLGGNVLVITRVNTGIASDRSSAQTES